MMCSLLFKESVAPSTNVPPFNRGFTLVEVAIVMVIIGVILGSVLGPLSAQSERRRISQTESLLNEIHDAMLGYAVLNGHLPCPASTTSNGLEFRDGGVIDSTVDCDSEHGLVPSSTLGLRGSFDSATGVITDAWGSPINYSLVDVNGWEYAKNIDANPDVLPFRVCSSSACDAADVLVSGLVAVLYSLGPDADLTPGSVNQAENTDNDDNFVDALESEATGAEFDDLLVWLSPNTLTLKLVQAGQIGN